MVTLATLDSNLELTQIFKVIIKPKFGYNYNDPSLYEMRLLDDESELNSDLEHMPLYETGPLYNEKPIGSFFGMALAFCLRKESLSKLND